MFMKQKTSMADIKIIGTDCVPTIQCRWATGATRSQHLAAGAYQLQEI
jgi:hypothetical protein